MAEEGSSENDAGEKTEEATEERRDKMREQGNVVQSRELTSTITMLFAFGYLSFYGWNLFESLKKFLKTRLSVQMHIKMQQTEVVNYFAGIVWELLKFILPLTVLAALISGSVTLLQTQFNFSWEKLEFSWNKLNPVSGIKRMFSMNTVVELLKNMSKMVVISVIAGLIFFSEHQKIPGVINLSLLASWLYLGRITNTLFWSIGFAMLFIAAADFFYQYISFEQKIKMSKQEVKEEYKQREVDPQIKNRIRKMQREIANRKTMESTKKATVLITNPTHYSIAIHYEIGMRAPIVLAKGVDLLALRMREIAKENDIPIVENRPLARSIYDTIPINREIPENLYKAVSEVIRYVYKIKGVKIKRSNAWKQPSKPEKA